MDYSSKNRDDYEDLELFLARQRKLMVRYLLIGILIAVVFSVVMVLILTLL